MIEESKHTDESVKANRHSTLLIMLAIFLISLALNHTLYRIFIVDIDETHMIKRAIAIFCGEMPWVDFKLFTYSPGNYYFLAFFLWLFSPSLIVMRHLWVVLRSISNVLAFLVSKRLMPIPFSFIPARIVRNLFSYSCFENGGKKSFGVNMGLLLSE